MDFEKIYEEREAVKVEKKKSKKTKQNDLNKEIEESLEDNAEELDKLGFPSGLGSKKLKLN